MHAKILRPKDNGKVVYANTGSAQRTANYLQKEAKENGQAATFFGSAEKGIYTADEVVALIDGNRKGLGKEEEKFHSLVLSPSTEEAAELGNDSRALQQYTRDVMKAYAKNFKLKGGRELGEKDLVWAAVIHQERKNRGTDEGVQGEQKPGLQTHIHVIVSARDATQRITLNPNTTTARFNRVQFQAQANVLLEERLDQINHRKIGSSAPTRSQRVAEKAATIKERAATQKEKKELTPGQVAAKDARLDVQVKRVNSKLDAAHQLNPEQVKAAAKERSYDNVFYATLGRIERNAEKGIYTSAPYEYLHSGKVQRAKRVQELPNQRRPDVQPKPTIPEKQQALPGVFHRLEHSINQLSRALAPKTRTQDVRSEEEKARDYEHEM